MLQQVNIENEEQPANIGLSENDKKELDVEYEAMITKCNKLYVHMNVSK